MSLRDQSSKPVEKTFEECKVPHEPNELDRLPGEGEADHQARHTEMLKSDHHRYTRLSFKAFTDKHQGTTADGRPRCLAYGVGEGISLLYAERIPCPNPEWEHWDKIDPFPYPGKARIVLPCLQHAVEYLKWFYRKPVQNNKAKLAEKLKLIEELTRGERGF